MLDAPSRVVVRASNVCVRSLTVYRYAHVLQAVVILSSVLSRYDMQLAGAPEDVGMSTGATIHTKNGLMVRLTPRSS